MLRAEISTWIGWPMPRVAKPRQRRHVLTRPVNNEYLARTRARQSSTRLFERHPVQKLTSSLSLLFVLYSAEAELDEPSELLVKLHSCSWHIAFRTKWRLALSPSTLTRAWSGPVSFGQVRPTCLFKSKQPLPIRSCQCRTFDGA